MSIFRKIAIETTTLSDLMTERTKKQIDDLIKDYPEGFTITDFDITELKGEDGVEKVGVFTIAEDESIFCFAGLVLTNMFKSWISLYEGDKEITREAYADAKDFITVKAYKKKVNNSNRTVTAITVL